MSSGSLAVPGWETPSWEQVVADHRSRVYRLAYRLTGNPHDAEDLTHDVFVRVFRSLSTFRPGSFEGWLHRITTNLFLDDRRRARRARTEPVDPAEGRLQISVPDLAQVHVETQLSHDVAQALRELPEDFRVAVLLCDVEGLSYAEIADLLGIKSGTVRSRIHRGRRALQSALAHRAPTTREMIAPAKAAGAREGHR
jgi:RNA polymerase sigma factor (sigma-70 family)